MRLLVLRLPRERRESLVAHVAREWRLLRVDRAHVVREYVTVVEGAITLRRVWTGEHSCRTRSLATRCVERGGRCGVGKAGLGIVGADVSACDTVIYSCLNLHGCSCHRRRIRVQSRHVPGQECVRREGLHADTAEVRGARLVGGDVCSHLMPASFDRPRRVECVIVRLLTCSGVVLAHVARSASARPAEAHRQQRCGSGQ